MTVSLVTRLAMVFALGTCSSCAVRKVTVGVDNARFQHGYLNSKLLGSGALLLWDMNASTDRALTLAPGPDVTNNETVRHAGGRELVSMASSGVTLNGAGAAQGIPVEARAEIARQTAIVVRNFSSVRFRDPAFVLNEEDFAEERKKLGAQYADQARSRFILISGITLADDVNISIGSPGEKGNTFTLSIAGKEYQLSYRGLRSSAWTGSQEPVFIQPRVYKLVSVPEGATGYRFEEDRTIQFDLTSMLTDASTF